MAIDKTSLTGSWVHSHEEDSGDQKVYRPEMYKFPPSRGRSGFQLNPDGTMLEYGPDATDKTASRPGRWEIRPDQSLALFPAGSAAPSRVMKVAALSSTKLVVDKNA